jgi:DNA-binding NarL/FixJ family response regulator
MPGKIRRKFQQSVESKPMGNPRLSQGPPLQLLTPRERSVIRELLKGHENKEIAVDQKVTFNEVANAFKSIREKLHLTSHAQIVIWACERRGDLSLWPSAA